MEDTASRRSAVIDRGAVALAGRCFGGGGGSEGPAPKGPQWVAGRTAGASATPAGPQSFIGWSLPLIRPEAPCLAPHASGRVAIRKADVKTRN